MNPPKPVYENLFNQVKDKDYFVITTNVDHCFQKAGFDKHKLFYTQGDYGLFQCSEPCCRETFDNEEMVRAMLEAQGFSFAPDGSLVASENRVGMKIPSNLVPKCPHCGKPLTTNLRADGTFVEDEGWRTANMRYEEFVRRHEGLNVLYLELGVGFNTPIIIKYPFWSAAGKNAKATYACLNAGEACAPEALMDRAILINGDIAQVLEQL
jgi:NAD-dependent SIR2 family protein deacetylase